MTTNKNTKQTNGKENKKEYDTQQDMIDFFKSHVIVCGIPPYKKEE